MPFLTKEAGRMRWAGRARGGRAPGQELCSAPARQVAWYVRGAEMRYGVALCGTEMGYGAALRATKTGYGAAVRGTKLGYGAAVC
eukprot:701788-Rhodomonas_salina.1